MQGAFRREVDDLDNTADDLDAGADDLDNTAGDLDARADVHEHIHDLDTVAINDPDAHADDLDHDLDAGTADDLAANVQ